MEWLVALLGFVVLVVIAGGLLAIRDARRGPVCPECGRRDTFGPEGNGTVCDNCRLDIRSYDF